ALAKLIRDTHPRLYAFVFNHRDKRSAARQLDLTRRTPALHVSQKFPATNGCLSPVMPIAPHPSNRNAIITYDLRVDPEPLLALDADAIYERIFTPSEDLPDDTPRIALKGVHLNKCPVLAPFDMLKADEAERLNLDIPACRRHWKAIHDRIDAVVAKAQAVFDAHQFGPATDADTALYDGFVDHADRKLADGVHKAGAEQLATIEFADKRLNDLLFRYRGRHFPDT